MSRYAKNIFYVGFDEQTEKGTGVDPVLFPEYIDGDVSITPEMDYTHYTPAGGQYPDMGLIEKVRVPNSFTILGTPNVTGAILAYAFGADSVTGTEDPYEHEITFADRADMPWFSTEVSAAYDSDQTDPIIARFVDCRIASLSISAESGMPLMLNPTIQAIDLEKQATETEESFEDNNPFIFYQGTYTIDSSATVNITNFSIELTNSLDEDDFTNAIIREDIPLIGREATVSFTLKFEDGTRFFDTYMNDAHDSLAKALESGDFNVKFENDVEADETGYRSLEIDIPQLDHVSASTAPGAGDGTMEYECEAVVTKGTGEFMTVTLNNDHETAYIA